MKTADVIDLDKAKLDPASVFHSPKDVLSASGLSIEDKKAILILWEADAEALLRATEEGMPPADNRNPADLSRAVHWRSSRCRRAAIQSRQGTAAPRSTLLSTTERTCAMVTELNATEARQATKRPRAMLLVLVVSLMLAGIAGLALAVGWISLPWGA